MVFSVNNKTNSQFHFTKKDCIYKNSVQSRYTVSGIIGRFENKKSLNTNCIKAFQCGADPSMFGLTELSRTGETSRLSRDDLLRDRLNFR